MVSIPKSDLGAIVYTDPTSGWLASSPKKDQEHEQSESQAVASMGEGGEMRAHLFTLFQ